VTHRDERGDRGRHNVTAAGSNAGGSSLQQQQKPPRFQNQQRYQQQQQQAINERSYGHQNWSTSYNESNYGGTWPGRNSAPSGGATKSGDDFGASSHRESYGTVSHTSRNKSTNQQQMGSGGYKSSFDSLDSQVNRGPGGQYDGVGTVQNFGQQQDISFNSAPKFSNQHSASLSRETFNNYSGSQNHQSNQIYAMNFPFKEACPSSLNNTHSISSITSSSPYSSDVYSSNTNYGGMVPSDGPASNQYIPDSKTWQWHKGDKCMAKYWEDNMVSFLVVIMHVLFLCIGLY
jgi:hypothetical protein